MNYKQSVEYIHSLLVFGIKPGLDRISALLEKLGNPQNNMNFVHIAGTNGKGSTSTMLSDILCKSGYKTGLFISPYVFDFCERIQVNSSNISRDDLASCVSFIKPYIEQLVQQGIVITEFEAITAAALLHFRNSGCEYAVMEVGLGGRFDATNVIPCPQVAVITSISTDHTKILGNTIKKIAFEKCGIIKKNTNVVTTSFQDKEALEVIKKTAYDNDVDLTVADGEKVKIIRETARYSVFEYKGEEYKLALAGRHQIENAIGVIEAAKCIENISEDCIKYALENVVMHGRMELIKDNVLIDGGHNDECSQALAALIEENYSDREITAVIGMMADKECEKYLSNVLPLCKRVIFTKPDNPRSETPENLRQIAQKYIKKIDIENNPKIAYDIAVNSSQFVLVCGSFYLLSDIFNE